MYEMELDRGKTRKFMVACHRGQKRADGSAYSRHPKEVAELAESWGVRHFRNNRLIMPLDRVTIVDMWHAAMLHDTIEDGRATWDDILGVTNLAVAELVATLSHDNRLSRPRRLQEYTNCLVHADYPAKIVKLADLYCNLQDALVLLRSQPEKAKTFLEGWPDEVVECIAAVEKLSQRRFGNEWDWCRMTALSLCENFRRWTRREDILREIDAYPGTHKCQRES